ncbi:MAG: CehA/McbA family metallohydrolase [Planctomycetota bacterium]|jgi:hypothetical protein
MAKYDYRGAIHCHSDFSDGKASFDEIAAAANEAGLDFVMTTDHDTLKPRDQGHDGWKDSTLFIVGAEITPEKNHLIVFGDGKLKGVTTLHKKQPQEVLDEVSKQGWLSFLAHPDHQGTKRFDIPSYSWEAWDAKGFTGMGIWDFMTDWQSKLDRDDVTVDVYNNFAQFLAGPRPETLKRWDEMNKTGKVVGIGELDNHAKEYKFEDETLKVFPFDVAFRTVLNHVLLNDPLHKDPAKAAAQILDAVKHGRLYISFDHAADPTEFSFEIDDGEQVAGMGDEFPLTESAEVFVSLPEDGLISILRDGQTVLEEQGNEAVLEITEPGVYRVEVLRNELMWIVSNPIFVKS